MIRGSNIYSGGTTLKTIAILALSVLLPVSAFSQSDVGKKLYDDWCAQCHGYKGDGKGYASGDYTLPQPRDFISGIYKFRSTPTGEPPTDDDIIRSTREGNPGTSMPPWTRFSTDELKAMTSYIKGFAEETFEFPGEPVQIGKAPAVTDELLSKGKELYEKAKCWECHGKLGRGDGEKGWQEKFKDDWGQQSIPTDITHAWELRNGASLEDLYRTITTGFDGTPMASFQDAYTDEDRWALAHYISSLQIERNTGSALTVKKVNAIPSSVDDEQWDNVDYIDLPLSGQIIFKPRQFSPTILNMRVKSIYTDTEIAVMLEWTDKKPNKGDDGLPPDAVRLQFPVEMLEGAEKPYFYLGDKNHAVNLWYWKSSDNQVVELHAKGQREAPKVRQEKTDVTATASFSDGLYRVVFTRQLDSGDENNITFSPGRFIPFSVAVYDGQNNDQDNRATVSAWYYVMLEPRTPLKVYIAPPVAALAFIGISISIRRKLRKQFDTKDNTG
jgi:DMSO reductase family type II enzyme heme b subunit